MVSPSKGHHQASPARGRPRGETSKPSARARSPRTACNFCHDKRVKCVMAQGESRCEQCLQRNTNCVFSTKAKTGPKPKASKVKMDGPTRQKGKNSRSSSRRVRGTAQAPSTLPKGGGRARSSGNGHERSSSSSSSNDFDNGGGSSTSVVAAAPMTTAQPPVPPNTAIGVRERLYLGVFIGTLVKFVPLVSAEALSAALNERQRAPHVMAAAVGAKRVAYEQAQAVGAISLGALISGDIKSAEAYHMSLRYHLGDVAALSGEEAVPSLALVALYWQHKGEDELKAEWVAHARRILTNVQDIPAGLVLSIEYLDYSREARHRPGVDLMSVNLRSLHSISCLLANMPAIVNPSVGRAAAVTSCEELRLCILGLRNEKSVELALLLCASLRALLLAMLGQRDAATEVLDTIPPLVKVENGGNPSAVRALPLSWDALLIASALSFLLGQGPTYERLRAAVELATAVPAEARWTFCLPEPGSDPRVYVTHECQSSSNICNIMCEIANRTSFGMKPFYPEDEQGQQEERPNSHEQQQHLQPSLSTAPALILSSQQQLIYDSSNQHSEQHLYSYGGGPHDSHDHIAAAGAGSGAAAGGSDGGGGGGGGGSGGAVMSFLDDDLANGGGEGGAVAAPVSDDMGAQEPLFSSVACKRRRTMVGVEGCEAGGDGGLSNQADGGYLPVHESGGVGVRMPQQPPTHPVYGGAACNAGHDGTNNNEDTNVFNLRASGGTSSNPGEGLPGASFGGGGGIGGDDDLDSGLGLTSCLHNMSLSRLSVPLSPGSGGVGGVPTGGFQQDPGLLGRVPSEGILDLNSSFGSFAMDMGGTDTGGVGGVGGGIGGGGDTSSDSRLGSFTGYSTVDYDSGGANASSFGGIMIPAYRRSGSSSVGMVGRKRSLGSTTANPSPPRLASFTTYSTALCRSSSSSMFPGQRSSGGCDDGSIGQCGSDLGQDIVASAEDFMDEEGNDDICGNILSVDALLSDRVSMPGGPGAGGGGKDGGRSDNGEGGGGAAAPPLEGEAGGGEGGGGGGVSLLAPPPTGGGGGGDVSLSLEEGHKSAITSALADFYEAGDVPPLPPPLPLPSQP